MLRVLFVCLGNICRSPMAEGVFGDMVEKAGLSDQIQVDSAGIGGWHVGDSAHRGTRDVLAKHGIPYEGHARQINATDFQEFDYVLTMDHSNLEDIGKFDTQDAIVAMFLRYANANGTVEQNEVPDPYYSGRFEEVYDLVERGSQALLGHIRAMHNI